MRARAWLVLCCLSPWLLVFVSGLATSTVRMAFADVLRQNVPAALATQVSQSLELQLKFSRIVSATVTYPTSGSSYPVLLLGVEAPDRYTDLPPLIAERGVLVVCIELKASSQPLDYAADFLHIWQQLVAESSRSTSILYTKVGRRLVVGGHGRAADAALLLADRAERLPQYVIGSDVQFAGYLAMAPILAVDGVASAAATLPSLRNTSVLLTAGSTDCRWPASAHALVAYAAVTVGVCKSYVEAVGGSHCSFGPDPQPPPSPPNPAAPPSCARAEQACGAHVTISPANQRALFNGLVYEWVWASLNRSLDAWLAFNSLLRLPHTSSASSSSSSSSSWSDEDEDEALEYPYFYLMDCTRNGTRFTGIERDHLNAHEAWRT